MTKINIIGAGLAGSECAWQLAKRGFEVEIFEMRNENRKTFAHRTQNFAELVCSNSLRSDEITTAIGLLHQEMRQLDSLIMRSAEINKVPAGSALAVDRDGFSKFIENELLNTKKVKISRQEIQELQIITFLSTRYLLCNVQWNPNFMAARRIISFFVKITFNLILIFFDFLYIL